MYEPMAAEASLPDPQNSPQLLITHQAEITASIQNFVLECTHGTWLRLKILN